MHVENAFMFDANQWKRVDSKRYQYDTITRWRYGITYNAQYFSLSLYTPNSRYTLYFSHQNIWPCRMGFVCYMGVLTCTRNVKSIVMQVHSCIQRIKIVFEYEMLSDFDWMWTTYLHCAYWKHLLFCLLLAVSLAAISPQCSSFPHAPLTGETNSECTAQQAAAVH